MVTVAEQYESTFAGIMKMKINLKLTRMKRKVLNYLSMATLAIFVVSCSSDNECDTTCPTGQVQLLNCSCAVDASTIKPDPCDGTAPCAAGQVKVYPSCACQDLMTVPCDGKTCNTGEILNAATCNCEVIPAVDLVVRENITANTTWTSDNVYILGGRITVEAGATLTIEPGTVIKGQAGTGANATALMIARDAMIMAEGTATAPIIFTSIADELTPGDIVAGNFGSPNLTTDINGLWGGVIVLGRAPISASNANGDVNEVQIEGIPTSDPNGLYGGNDPADNSGVIKYVSIRHGGSNIGAGNEINGLTLGGVGNATVIENVEVVANQDDGIEWFGGSVNVKNVLVWNVGDDGIDTDQAWTGTLDNFFVLGVTGHNFELDGPEGSANGAHTIQNGTVVSSDPALGRVAEDLINVDNNSEVTLKNIFITGIVDGQKINRVTAALVSFENIVLDVDAGNLANYVNGDVPAGVTAGVTGFADKAPLDWTWAAQAGMLSSF